MRKNTIFDLIIERKWFLSEKSGHPDKIGYQLPGKKGEDVQDNGYSM
jgi:hypothetical protein